MTDFGSIYSMSNRPTSPAPDYMQAQHNMLSMQALGQQVQQGQMQTQQMQQDQQDQQTLRQLQMTGQYKDPASLADAAAQQGVNPKTVMALKMQGMDYQGKVATMAKTLAETAKTQGEVAKQNIDLHQAMSQDVSKLALTAAQDPSFNQAKWTQGLSSIAQKYAQPGQQPPGALPGTLQEFAQFNPDTIGHAISAGQTFQQAYDRAFGKTQSDATGITQVYPPAAPGQAPKVVPVVQLPQTSVGKVNYDLENGNLTAGDAAALKRKETYIAPTAVTILNQGAPGGANLPADPQRPWRQKPEFTSLPGNMQLAVDQYLNGDYKINPRAQGDRQVQLAAAKIDPGVSEHDYELKQKALADPQVNATSAALGHIGDFKAALAQLPPQTQAQVLNTPLNKLSTTFSDSPYAQIISGLQTTGLSLSEEYGKALGAGQNVAGDMKREAVFDPSKPIGQLTANLKAVGNLLNQTIGAKENTLNRNNPNRTPLSLLDPGANQVLQDLGINHTPGNRSSWQQQPANPGTTPPPTVPGLQKLTPQQASSLAPGTHFLGLDGVERVKH